MQTSGALESRRAARKTFGESELFARASGADERRREGREGPRA
jgi:hypothetical protein